MKTMQKIKALLGQGRIVVCLIMLLPFFSYSQSTNIFPNTGNVGIGTTSPVSKLHVAGTMRLDSSANFLGMSNFFADVKLWHLSASGSSTRFLGIEQDGRIVPMNPMSGHLRYLTIDSAIKVGDSSIYILGSQPGFAENHIFSTHGPLVLNGNITSVVKENTLLNSYGGSVGIGYNSTTLPTGMKLSVRGLSFLSGPVGIFGYPQTGINLRVSASNNDVGIMVDHIQQVANTGVGVKVVMRNQESKALSINYYSSPASREKLAIYCDGTATIGTNLPYAGSNIQMNMETNKKKGIRVRTFGSALDTSSVAFLADVSYIENKAISVISRAPNYQNGPREVFRVTGAGIAWMQELRVRVAPFPDYVFEEGYHLMNLDSLEEYVQTNHKLPGMPSAAEVESESANIGELVRLQQEKIEELTLYVIELKKEIQTMRTTKEETR
jgi:hypothetical protein